MVKMKKQISNGFLFGFGFILFISMFSIIFAVGFHIADEVLSGTFLGNYSFQGYVNFTNANVIGLSLVPSGAIMSFNLANCPNGWIPSDGTLGTLDLRGQFLRGLNDFGTGIRNDGMQDPDGNLRILGDWQNDTFMSHGHPVNRRSGVLGGDRGPSQIWSDDPPSDYTSNYMSTIGYTGDNETRPKNIGIIYCQKE